MASASALAFSADLVSTEMKTRSNSARCAVLSARLKSSRNMFHLRASTGAKAHVNASTRQQWPTHYLPEGYSPCDAFADSVGGHSRTHSQ